MQPKMMLSKLLVSSTLSYLLVPEMHHDFPVALLKNFVPVVKPRYLNWAQVVLWIIGRASVHAQS